METKNISWWIFLWSRFLLKEKLRSWSRSALCMCSISYADNSIDKTSFENLMKVCAILHKEVNIIYRDFSTILNTWYTFAYLTHCWQDNWSAMDIASFITTLMEYYIFQSYKNMSITKYNFLSWNRFIRRRFTILNLFLSEFTLPKINCYSVGQVDKVLSISSFQHECIFCLMCGSGIQWHPHKLLFCKNVLVYVSKRKTMELNITSVLKSKI